MPQRPAVGLVSDGAATYGISALWTAAHPGELPDPQGKRHGRPGTGACESKVRRAGALQTWRPRAELVTPPGAGSSRRTRKELSGSGMRRPTVAPASPSQDLGKARGAGGE